MTAEVYGKSHRYCHPELGSGSIQSSLWVKMLKQVQHDVLQLAFVVAVTMNKELLNNELNPAFRYTNN